MRFGCLAVLILVMLGALYCTFGWVGVMFGLVVLLLLSSDQRNVLP